MPFDVHGALLVAVVAGVTALIRFLPFVVFGRRAAHAEICGVSGRGAALRHHGDARRLLPARCGPARPHPRPAGAACRGRRGGAAPVEEEHAAQHRRGHRPVYGAGAGGVCVNRKKCASPQNPLGPLCEGAPPGRAVGGENLAAIRNISGCGKVLSPPALRAHLPRRGRQDAPSPQTGTPGLRASCFLGRNGL